MHIQYVVFEHLPDQRCFRFECHPVGQPAIRLVVSTALDLFSAYRVSIQEGPAISARKISAGLEILRAHYQLTAEDFHAYSAELAAAAERKAASRKRPNQRLARRPRSLHTGHWG